MCRLKQIVGGVILASAVLLAGSYFFRSPSNVDAGRVVRHAGQHYSKYISAQNKTVVVRTSHGQGTGVVIKRASVTNGKTRIFVWTAAHVVKGIARAEIRLPIRNENEKCGVTSFEGRVIFVDTAMDCALLWVKAPESYFEFAEFATEAPQVGDKVYHCGNWLGEDFDGSVTDGIISQVGVMPNVENPGDWWEMTDATDATACPGSSGGPVFSEDGKVVGLIVGAPGRGSLGWCCFLPARGIKLACDRMNFSWAFSGIYCSYDAGLELLAQDIEKGIAKEEPIIIFMGE